VTVAEPPLVRGEVAGGVGVITLDRPDRLNALTPDMLAQLGGVLAALEEDSRVRAVVLQAEGRMFCAGADLAAVEDLISDSGRYAAFLENWHDTLDLFRRSPLPVVGAVHGHALAGGLELLLACDFLVMEEEAELGDQHAVFGLFPAGGSLERLPSLVGRTAAAWLLMSGERCSAERAWQLGLVHEVVGAGMARRRALEMGQLLSTRSAELNERIKRLLRLRDTADLKTYQAAERDEALAHMSGIDAQIGLSAFRHRIPPRFTDR
jgi:enoyl-CoA hydratase/carnithine racemase